MLPPYMYQTRVTRYMVIAVLYRFLVPDLDLVTFDLGLGLTTFGPGLDLAVRSWSCLIKARTKTDLNDHDIDYFFIKFN